MATNTPRTTRRATLKALAGGATLTILPSGSLRAGKGANARIRVGVMGLSRGLRHVDAFHRVDNVEVAAICDVDEKRLAAGMKHVEKGGRETKAVHDFRAILEDKEIDALSIAAPNFWHAPASILACQAGKHVYVEKPGSHNAAEAIAMAAAAKEHDRRVQLGTQRRSLPHIIDAIEKVRAGTIGEVKVARCWYRNARKGIGIGKAAAVPDGLDFDLWQGPAPRRPYKDNLVHYNWHWHWHWGGGELANNGVHALDIARWGLAADLPEKITYMGGRYYYEDDQETPDTGTAIYDFGGETAATWEHSSCDPRKNEPVPFITFYGDGGSLAIDRAGHTLFDPNGKEMEKREEKLDDIHHFQNFCDAIRIDTPLTADIADSWKSAMLCHLGNIAYRTGGAAAFDPEASELLDNPEGTALWGRDYSEGWVA